MKKLSQLSRILITTAMLLATASIVYAQEEQMVDVDGHKMRVQTAGLDDRKPDEPVVVFENGALSPIESWGTMLEKVADFAPVIAYDRSTVGQSEWDGKQGTPTHVTENLWVLLNKLEVEPPYVLVGWSWGGDLIRYHSGSYPEDISGLVYVDPAGHSPNAMLSVLQTIGFDEEQYAADVDAMENALPSLSQAMQADVKPINQIYAARSEPDYGPVPSVPTAVLLAGKYREPPTQEIEAFGKVPYDRRAHFEATLRSKIERLSKWALSSSEGLFIVARNSGHAIHRQKPGLVVDAIRRVVFPDVARQLRQAIDQEGIAALEANYEALKQRYPSERFNEALLNRLGYDLLRAGRVEDAIAVFEYNVEKYPDAWNPYDSLGDAYSVSENKEKAMESYRRSLELNPNSPSARKLKELERQ